MSEPTGISAKITAILDKADAYLKSEAARFIGYGAGVVVVLVVLVSNALGITRFGENIDLVTALGLTATATATLITLIEGIRHFVYSISSVEKIADASADAGVAIIPAPPAK